MPEYLAPGVYIEENSFRPRTIEGVSTSTAAFVGPTRFGPIAGLPELLTSMHDFERIYGGIDPLEFDGEEQHNYLAASVRVFFENGGRRCYVARAFDSPTAGAVAEALLPQTGPQQLRLSARHPGRAGNFEVTMKPQTGPNVLDASVPTSPRLRGTNEHQVVWIDSLGGQQGVLAYIHDQFDTASNTWTHDLRSHDGTADISLGLVTNLDLAETTTIRVITVDVEIGPRIWAGLSLQGEHRNSLERVFERNGDRATQLSVPLVVEREGLEDGPAIAAMLLNESQQTGAVAVLLDNGTDGLFPGPDRWAGNDDGTNKSGLESLTDLPDVSVVAAPGSTARFGRSNQDADNTRSVIGSLIAHCEQMGHRIAIVDSPPEQEPSEVLAFRGEFDSSHAALYYPWVSSYDPVSRSTQNFPPSGYVAGIYARSDTNRGVHKAPANETIALAVGFESTITNAQQDVLNPAGVNCLRNIELRGPRVWGARTMSSNPEWKYVNLRRYFAFLETSIDRGTEWAVFEPNGPALWTEVKQVIEDFLFNEFRKGALLGDRPADAFFARCDRSTMTQSDLDNGRLVCEIGVAPLRPAEFVVFRMSKRTAEADL